MKMRLDDIRSELPEIPDFIHKMIQDEVDKQLQDNNNIHIVENKRRNYNIGRVAAAAAVCVLAVSSAAYAGTRFYHMYLDKQGKYSVATEIEISDEGLKTVSLPKEINDIDISANYVPDGMIWNDEYKLSYANTPYMGGISISSVLMDMDGLDSAVVDKGVVESENQNFGSYEGVYLRYLDLKEDKSFNQRIYMLCPEEYRVLIIYIGDDVSKDDAIKFAENLTITKTDKMIETEGMNTWSDLVNPQTDYDTPADTTVADTKIPIHQVGDAFNITSSGEDKGGNTITSDKITVKVDNVQISDDLKLFAGKEIPEEWKATVGSDGKLKDNNLSYVKSGDGVENLDKVVGNASVKQKLVYATITYTNNSDKELNHMLYLGTVMLMKHEDGQYKVYSADEESGENYDYVMGDGIAHTGEMTYSNVKESYGNGGNYISSLKPGESIDIEMAWIVNEDNLKDMYLNLNGNGGAYSIEDSDLEMGVVYIGK